MATSEERLRILTMVQEGKISAEQGSQLLSAIDAPSQPPSAPKDSDAPKVPGNSGRWFRVKVTSTLNDRPRVNVRLPVSLIKVGMKMGAKFSPEVEKIDLDQLAQFIENGEIGQLVDIYDEEDGEHVEVYIE
jgi:hypothetical protein